MRKQDIRLISILFIIVVLIIGFYNLKNNNEFWEMPVYNILNLLFALIFAFYLTQMKTDERKLKDKADDIISTILTDISDARFYRIAAKQDIEYLKLKHRSVSNKIDILDSVKDKLGFPSEIDYVKNNFIEYKELIGNHIEDLEYLTKSEKDLYNKISLIDNKLQNIIISLYK